MTQTIAPPPPTIASPPPPPSSKSKRTWKTWHLAIAAVVGLVIGAASPAEAPRGR